MPEFRYIVATDRPLSTYDDGQFHRSRTNQQRNHDATICCGRSPYDASSSGKATEGWLASLTLYAPNDIAIGGFSPERDIILKPVWLDWADLFLR